MNTIQHDPTLASTPPMGWNSWNLYGGDIHEELVKAIARGMVESGMKDVGYRYVNLDDIWHGGRDESGKLFPDPAKFPSGMRALADDIHSLGLKFGIYSCAGTKTCAGCPGSQGYEEIDARTFAEWGVDFLKYDYCHAPNDRGSAMRLYSTMGAALQATGRPIVFSICEWGCHRPWEWGRAAGGHLWRTTGDISDSWQSIQEIGFYWQRGLEKFHSPGGWNDPDMLVVGVYGKGNCGGGGCTDVEYQSHMTLWCLLAAPLLAACDLTNMNAATRAILTNPEVIAIDQDALGKQATFACRTFPGDVESWIKPLANGDLAVGMFNRSSKNHHGITYWVDLGIEGAYAVRDLWQRQDAGVFTESFSIDIPSHGAALLRLSKA